MLDIDNLICCPFCKGDLRTNTQNGQQWLCKRELSSYYCNKCNHKFPLVNSIVDFSPVRPKKRTLAQQLMESKSIVEKYEGKSGRGSWFFAGYLGISFKEEMALVKKIAHINNDDTVLDLACGTGLYTRDLAKEGGNRKVIGVDISWPMLKYAIKMIKAQEIENIALFHGDAHHLPLRDFSVDAAICCGALHIFCDVHQALEELSRVIKPNGHLALAVFFAESNLFGKFKRYWRKEMWGIHSFQETELKELLNKASFAPAISHAWGKWMIAGGTRKQGVTH